MSQVGVEAHDLRLVGDKQPLPAFRQVGPWIHSDLPGSSMKNTRLLGGFMAGIHHYSPLFH